MLRSSNLHGFHRRTRMWRSWDELCGTTTWSTTDKNAGITVDTGNMRAYSNGTLPHQLIRATNGISEGCGYFEITIAGAHAGVINLLGLCRAAITTGNPNDDCAWGYETGANGFYSGNFSVAPSPGINLTNDVYGFAYDADMGLVWMRRSSGYIYSGAPNTRTAPNFSGRVLATPMFPSLSFYNDVSGYTFTLNCGASAFSYGPPNT